MLKFLKNLPNLPGVYLFQSKTRSVIYVGKALNLKNRVRSYFTGIADLGLRTTHLIRQIVGLEWIPVESEFEALLLEAELIKKYQPRFNVRARDDKSPLYIKITREEFPKVLTARGRDLKLDKKAKYFGPFPKAGTARQILLMLRRIFPYCQQRKVGKAPCFWSHIGLCNPCPASIVKQTGAQRATLAALYRKNIKHLRDVLSGRSRQVGRVLETEMKKLASEENFEEAVKLRNQIHELSLLTAPKTAATAYIENPNLIEDRRSQEAAELFNLIGKRARLRKIPRRIECFDASHISGSNPTVSSITFIGGEPEKNLHRHFKIGRGGKDDLAFLSEAIKRRFTHPGWGKPDLLLIDGGKGQVKAAKEALKQTGVWLPVIGLAKRFETIIIAKKDGFTILRPPRHSPALKLLQRLRDEAHRFARSYHLKLRIKELHNGMDKND